MIDDFDLDSNSVMETCRICGVCYITDRDSSILISLFSDADEKMVKVREQMLLWKIKLEEGDGFPQMICRKCFFEFERVIKLRDTCEQMQEYWRHWNKIEEENQTKIKVKTEIKEEDEENCLFIYLDDDSCDFESGAGVTPELREEPVDGKKSLKDILSQPIKSEPGMALLKQEPGCNGAGSQLSLQCESCLFIADDYQQLRQHTVRIHETKKVNCTICSREFRDRTQLKYHLKWHRLHRYVKCVQCGFRASSKEALKEHRSAVHTKIACNICAKPILPRKLKQHMLIHESDEPAWNVMKCEYCLSRFNSAGELEQHQYTFHKPGKTTRQELVFEKHDAGYVCAICKEHCPTERHLDLHTMENHSNNDQVTPMILENDTQSETSDVTNEDEDGSALNGESFECYSGSRSDDVSFDSEYNNPIPSEELEDTTEHFETEPEQSEDEEDYQPQRLRCSQCENFFSDVEDLRTHFSLEHETSENDSIFKCHVCGREFKLQFRLKQHLKKHSL